MEETRREIVEAEEIITNGKTGTIRHRAIIKEERAEDGQLCVSICELYEDCDGQYTEDGEIRQNNDAGSRWKGSTPPHGWRSWPQPFERAVTHYRGLKEKPDGWWPSLPTRRVYTVDGLFEVLAIIAQNYVETLKEAGFPRAYVDGRLEGGGIFVHRVPEKYVCEITRCPEMVRLVEVNGTWDLRPYMDSELNEYRASVQKDGEDVESIGCSRDDLAKFFLKRVDH